MSKTNQIKVKKHTAESLNMAIPVTSITNPVSGLTIVFARLGARMVGVSLAWCAPEDEFKRKHGVQVATQNVYGPDDFQFQVPMPGAAHDQIVWQLTSMFDEVNFEDFTDGGAKGIYKQNPRY